MPCLFYWNNGIIVINRGGIIMNNELLGRYISEANIIMLVLDDESKVQFINNKGKKILKIDDDIIGTNWIEKYVNQDVDNWVSNVFNLKFDDKYGVDNYFESEMINGKGEIVHIAWNSKNLTSEDEKGMLYIGTNITEKKKLEKDLKLYSSVDELTQVFNTRTGIEILTKNFLYAKRRKKEFSLGLIELVNYSHINDEFGYFEGDQAVKILSNILSEDVRQEDTIIRSDSNQFTIVYPDCEYENAEMIMKRIENRINHFNEETHLEYHLMIKYSIANIFDKDFDTEDSMIFYLKSKL
jgi:diguanylate cyclase (GGDEF)-like protein/PAS domain S-box-containing protein